MKKKIFRFLSLIIFLFIFINIALSFLWPYITEYRINSKTYYSDSVLNSLEITREEELDFYKESWTNRKFDYVQFVEQYENTPKNQKFVNVDPENGRKIENNKNFIKNFIFYGSSQTFGYNVKDNQTIAANFKNILDKNYKDYCVYNFGSASHFSTQETIFFITHLLKGKIKKNDFIFFIDGMTEKGGFKTTKFSNFMHSMYEYFNLKYWNKYYFASTLFFESLPMVQLYKRISQKNRSVNINNEVESDYFKEETFSVFQDNILIRRGICRELEINCYTFLQPFPPNFRVQFKNELQKKTEYLIDLSALLSNEKELSYVAGHYSPESSMKIANSIFSIIIDDLD